LSHKLFLNMLTRSETSSARSAKFIIPLLFGCLVAGLIAKISPAQTNGASSINVESREVVVPFEAVEQKKTPRITLNSDGQYESYWMLRTNEISGLSTKSVHIFEDGKEQTILHFSFEKFHDWVVQDNVAQHLEYSCTPTGIWSGSDIEKIETSKSNRIHTYLLTYVPQPSAEGSCHRIALKIHNRHAIVFAPDQYCNTKDPLSDPLNGTALGNISLQQVDDERNGQLQFAVQVAALHGSSGSHQLQISANIPATLLGRKWEGNHLRTSIAILGLVFDKQNVLITRFSDVACLPSESNVGWTAPLPTDKGPNPETLEGFERWWEHISIPATYRTQIHLEPGEYRIEFVMTDGEKFGRSTNLVSLDDFSENQLSLSGIALCKRYHTPSDRERGPTRAPQFAPLLFNGVEFSPTGSMEFIKKSDGLMAYVEIYSPVGKEIASDKLYLDMKVTDAKSGDLKIGTGPRLVDSTIHLPNSGIPMVWNVAVDKLPTGAYRLEMQASDSAGNKTEWRTISFTIR
jgi:hypothetical protein